MTDEGLKCRECDKLWPLDRFNDKFGNICFKCRVANVGFSFEAGGPEGKQSFHENTIKSFAEKTVREAAANGIEAVPVPQASYTGPLHLPTPKKAAD